MGKKSKASSKEKKKGPKGKKARAKAKLDRQWGEKVIVDEQNDHRQQRKRIGKSRLLRRTGDSTSAMSREMKEENDHGTRKIGEFKKDKPQRRRMEQDDDTESSDDDGIDDLNFLENTMPGGASDDDEDEGETNASALSDLLKSIQHKSKTTKKKKSKNNSTKNHGHLEMETEDDSDILDDDGEESDIEDFGQLNDNELSDDADDNDDIDSINGETQPKHENFPNKDLFRERFGDRAPLDKFALENCKTKIPSIVALEETLELHVTSRQGQSQADKNTVGCTAMDELIPGIDSSRKDYQKIAQEAFDGNRIILRRQWQRQLKGSRQNSPFSEQQAPVYSFLTRYTDMLITTDSRKQRSEMHRLYMLHVLNHVLTSRSRILRHNRHLKIIEERQKAKEGTMKDSDDKQNDDSVDENQFRDQGFTRPTVLVLLPTRSTAYTFVHHLLNMLKSEVQQPHMERFEGDFGMLTNDDEEEGGNTATTLGKEQEERRKAVLKRKGKEWNELFGDDVNQDDDFKLGISLTPKAALGKTAKDKNNNESKSNIAVRLYSDFYKSDIIVASPLGLKMLIQKSEGGGDEEDEIDGNHDFLSSIEICLLEYADVMLMQNWDHVNYILSLLNKQPESNNNTDFSRVRNYFLDGQAENWRQLIISSKVLDPFLLNSFKRFGKSESGSVKMRRLVAPDAASIGKVLIPMRQVFQQVSASSPKDQGDSRVTFFVKNILPQILQEKQKHTMIYIPSYFDYVTLRNIMLKRELPFVSVTEYSRVTEVTRGRARFLQGRKPIMLFTGRCNFFHRHAIKGVRHLVMLGLPEHPDFYSNQVNLINTSSSSDPDDGGNEDDLMQGSSVAPSCLVLFTRYEAHALERIVGTDNCNRMLRSEKNTFMFYS